jgi:hypothetical protein
MASNAELRALVPVFCARRECILADMRAVFYMPIRSIPPRTVCVCCVFVCGTRCSVREFPWRALTHAVSAHCACGARRGPAAVTPQSARALRAAFSHALPARPLSFSRFVPPRCASVPFRLVSASCTIVGRASAIVALVLPSLRVGVESWRHVRSATQLRRTVRTSPQHHLSASAAQLQPTARPTSPTQVLSDAAAPAHRATTSSQLPRCAGSTRAFASLCYSHPACAPQPA